MKVKIFSLRNNGHNSLERFEEKIAEFCESVDVKDIKFSTSTDNSGYVHFSVMIVYA